MTDVNNRITFVYISYFQIFLPKFHVFLGFFLRATYLSYWISSVQYFPVTRPSCFPGTARRPSGVGCSWVRQVVAGRSAGTASGSDAPAEGAIWNCEGAPSPTGTSVSSPHPARPHLSWVILKSRNITCDVYVLLMSMLV